MEVSNRDRPPIPAAASEAQHQSPVDVIDEYMERDRRKNNLIIHNFPESTTTSQSSTDKVKAFSELVRSELKLKSPKQYD